MAHSTVTIFCRAVGVIGLLLTGADGLVHGESGQMPAAKVYQSRFDAGADNHWSVKTVPSGDIPFFGELHEKEATLTLRALPAHKRLRLQCDLLILKSWDGDVQGDGPDTLAITLADGRKLLSATFANNTGTFGAGKGTFAQSYPDRTGLQRHPAGTGAAKQNDPAVAASPNATYHLDFTFPHSAAEVQFKFGASFKEIEKENRNQENESWGLAKVRVEALAAPDEKLDEPALAAMLGHLRGKDPVKAHQALWRLAGAGPEALDYLRRQDPLAVDDQGADAIKKLVAHLDDDEFATREKALQALKQIPGAERNKILSELLKGKLSLEQKTRIEAVLAERPEADDAFRGRLLHLLEVIGSDEARELAKRVAPPKTISGPTWEEK